MDKVYRKSMPIDIDLGQVNGGVWKIRILAR
jgi:hypothetical protein